MENERWNGVGSGHSGAENFKSDQKQGWKSKDWPKLELKMLKLAEMRPKNPRTGRNESLNPQNCPKTVLKFEKWSARLI